MFFSSCVSTLVRSLLTPRWLFTRCHPHFSKSRSELTPAVPTEQYYLVPCTADLLLLLIITYYINFIPFSSFVYTCWLTVRNVFFYVEGRERGYLSYCVQHYKRCVKLTKCEPQISIFIFFWEGKEYSACCCCLLFSGSFYVFFRFVPAALLTFASVALSFYAFCLIFTHKKCIKSVSLSLKSQIYDSYSRTTMERCDDGTSLARFCALGEIVNGFGLSKKKKVASLLRNGIDKWTWGGALQPFRPL